MSPGDFFYTAYMVEIKNKKQFFITVFFVLLGLVVIGSTLKDYGLRPGGHFGLIGGAVAIFYAFIRRKLIGNR